MAHHPVILKSLHQEENQQLYNLLEKISDQDKAWLSGYLYGVSQEIPQTTLSSSSYKVAILYATQSGNSKGIAEDTTKQLKQQGIEASVYNMNNIKLKKLAEYQVILAVVATYGEGEPPDDAIGFFEEITGKKKPFLKDIAFATLALGDSSYEHFCTAGHDFHQALQNLGAKPLADVFEADLDFEEVAQNWQKHILEYLSSQQTAIAPEMIAAAASSSLPIADYNREHPYSATILKNQKITGDESNLDIRHIEIDIADSGISYQTGDDLGIWFENDTKLVDEIIAQIGANKDDIIELKGQKLPLKEALQSRLEITASTTKFITQYAKISGAKKLEPLLKDKASLREYAAQTQIIDVLKIKKTPIVAQDFINMLRLLTPRLYSIASSPQDVDDEVHLSVKVIGYECNNQARFGGASGYLSRLKEDDNVRIYVENNDKFRLPQDDKNIIMIGDGTGIAPYRGFMYERQNNQAQGKNWLLYNNPSFEQDFLYQSEWSGWQKNNLLTDYNFVWHKDGSKIGELLLEQANKIWQWLQDGAFVYVAGSQSHMAKAAHEALLRIAIEQGGLDEKSARTWMNELKSQNRYQRDIY
ncbi:MAG: sulfite reductase flavoprotein subunit alpha [Alphaproteobacteria bacterium]